MKKRLLAIRQLAFVFLLALTILAAPANKAAALEINYPRFPGVEAPQDFMPKIGVDPGYPWSRALPLFASYFYVLALIVATALVVLSIIIGGALYVTAGNNVGRLFDAKEQIIAGLMGLVLLLGSYLLLNVLNPQLTVFRLPGISGTSLPTHTVLPEPQLPGQVYWELPLGTLQERVLARIKEVDGPAKTVKEKMEALANTVKRDPSCIALCSTGLVDLLKEKCDCNNLASECNNASCIFPQLLCIAAPGVPAQKTNLCRDYDSQIVPKKNDVESKISDLNTARLVMFEKEIALTEAASQLWATNELMKTCYSGGPIDRATFLQELKDLPETETRRVWDDLDPGNNPLTFYCSIEEGLVQSILDQWSIMMQRVLSGFNLGPGACQGGVCPEGTGYCAPDNLRLYFPTDSAAYAASVICQRESSSNPAAANYGCLNGTSLDYSIGLFQINLLAWCPGAFTYTVNPIACTIIDQVKLDQCKTDLFTPEGNIRKAVQISDNGIDWTPWAAAAVCGIVPGLPVCLPPPPEPPVPLGSYDLLAYLRPDNAPANNINNGEVFRSISTGGNSFRIQKSTNASYYEDFEFDGQYIYHLKDTTWATEAGNVQCVNGSGDAYFTLLNGDYGTNLNTCQTWQDHSGEEGMQWVPRVMKAGDTFTSQGTVIGFSKSNQQCCDAPYDGPGGGHTVRLDSVGCVKFPNNVVRKNVAIITITGGAGAGETFFYDKSRGWIGFHRGDPSAGAYLGDNSEGSACP